MPAYIITNTGPIPSVLDPSLPVTLINALTAVQTLATAGTAASFATNPLFTVNASPEGKERTLNLHAKGILTGVPTLPTTLTVSLYSSTDGGVTWNLYQAAIALVTATVATDVQVLHLVSGLVYQLLVTTLTLGSATSVSVDGNLS